MQLEYICSSGAPQTNLVIHTICILAHSVPVLPLIFRIAGELIQFAISDTRRWTLPTS